MNVKQYTFSDMAHKSVINIADGRELGHVCDLVFNNCGAVQGFVVPGKKSFFKTVTSADNIFIPWNRIVKIGSDVIIVELVGCSVGTFSVQQEEKKPQSEYTPVYTPPQPAFADQPQAVYGSEPQSGAQTVYHPDE